jgi:hypothetical protein
MTKLEVDALVYNDGTRDEDHRPLEALRALTQAPVALNAETLARFAYIYGCADGHPEGAIGADNFTHLIRVLVECYGLDAVTASEILLVYESLP